MKLVKEHINEKFTQDSDPIKDLGIGDITFGTIKRGDLIISIKDLIFNSYFEMYKDRIMLILDVQRNKNNLTIKLAGFGDNFESAMYNREKALEDQNVDHAFGLITQTHTAPKKEWENNFKIYQDRELQKIKF